MSEDNVKDIAERIRTGDRRALAKSITRAESTRDEDRKYSNALLDELLNDTGGAMRIGISGTPGVGKSTFIESLGVKLCESGKRVAVLSIDPSSSVNGGSILGDKTRMPGLSANPSAFIRPSPSGTTLGGVGSRTHEAILYCEAAGFDVVLVETVGVGQSEVAASEMTDLFLLLLLPSGGDELQGIKRGVVELADLILINKADGALLSAAEKTVADYRAALHLLRSDPREEMQVEVRAISAATNSGIDSCWDAVSERWRYLKESGELESKRERQRLALLHNEIRDAILRKVAEHSFSNGEFSALQKRVRKNNIHPASAAGKIVQSIKIVGRND